MNDDAKCPMCKQDQTLELWDNASFQFHYCAKCELHWATGVNSFRISSSYDLTYYKRNYLGDANDHQRMFFRSQLHQLCPRLSGRLVLDVGFGTGFFLEEALKQGWNVSGIELSEAALNYVRAVLGDRATLISGDLCTAHLPSGSFDLITFWDVLAHVSDPQGYLHRARELLKPGGVLVIKTPLRPAVFFARLTLLPAWVRESLVHWPWQIFHFSEFTLRRFLESVGFHGIETQVSPELPAQSIPWSHYCQHPKGAFLVGFHWIYNRLMHSRSLLLYAER
jgi:SAM-dependent methyltransferase